MKKNTLLLSILFFSFTSVFSQLKLDFEGQPFSTQSWTENASNWAISSGWANIRDYLGTTYNGTNSLVSPDANDFILENSEDFNLNSLWLQWDNNSSDATTITFTGYDVNDVQVGSPVVINTSTLNDGQYHNITLNLTGIRKVSFHPDGTFSSMGTCYLDYFDYSLNSVLPINWLDFTAQVKNNSVNLNWSIQQQINSKDFTVQHSTNGNTWKNLSVIKADAASNTVNNYKYLDNHPAYGTNYYRIAESDIAGRSSYSTVKTINFTSANTVFIIKGNPVTNGVLTVESGVAATLRLYTASGSLIWSKQISAGTNTINVNNYKGEYLLKANATAQKVIIK